MDQVGRGTGQAPEPVTWGVEIAHRELGPVRVTPLVSHRRVLRTSPLPVPRFLTKGITGSGPGGFLVVCPAFSALHGSLEVVGESEPPKAVFSVLASYLGWPPLLSLGCYRPLQWGLGPASSFCHFLWISGVA